MRELLEYESLRVNRIEQTYSVLFLDIDLFKNINDKFGHDSGDFVLKKTGDILKAVLRTTDTVSRWGGEEFLVLLPETAGVHLAAIGEKLRTAIEETVFLYNDQEIPVTLSIGGSSYVEGESIDAAVNRADKNLYRAKQEGRNRVVA